MRRLPILLALVGGLSLHSSCGGTGDSPGSSSGKRFLSIGTAPPGGAFFVVGGALGEVLGEEGFQEETSVETHRLEAAPEGRFRGPEGAEEHPNAARQARPALPAYTCDQSLTGESRGRPLYRRSPHLVGYWSSGQLVIRNYATGIISGASPRVLSVLDFFSDWRSPEELLEEMRSRDRSSLKRLLRTLVRKTLLQRSDRKPRAAEEGMDEWSEWNPAAGFLHSASKDPDFETGELDSERFLKWRLETKEIPEATKTGFGSELIDLPRPGERGAFPRVLLARRTWRKFGEGSVGLLELGTLLGLTFGVQKWMDLDALGRAALKTSPSGGARHPIEAYVLARRIRGLSPGLYHYDPDGHGLQRLIRGSEASRMRRYLPGQPWYASASLLVLMTAVFARTQWQYPYPRSYRAVLLEAGHFCQTFCLVATWLGLAPFETDALADSIIEKDLGIDGVRESVLYAAGAAPRPGALSWAPSVGSDPLPALFPPKRDKKR